MFRLPSSPSRATRSQFNQFEQRSGVMRGFVPLFYFLFFNSSNNNTINFCWCCWSSCILPNWTLVFSGACQTGFDRFSLLSGFLLFFLFSSSSGRLPWPGNGRLPAQMKRPCSHYLSASSGQRKADRLKQNRRDSREQ